MRAMLGRVSLAVENARSGAATNLERRDSGEWIATPVSQQDSSLLGKLAAAQGLVVRPPFAPPAKAGAQVDILRLPD